MNCSDSSDVVPCEYIYSTDNVMTRASFRRQYTLPFLSDAFSHYLTANLSHLISLPVTEKVPNNSTKYTTTHRHIPNIAEAS